MLDAANNIGDVFELDQLLSFRTTVDELIVASSIAQTYEEYLDVDQHVAEVFNINFPTNEEEFLNLYFAALKDAGTTDTIT